MTIDAQQLKETVRLPAPQRYTVFVADVARSGVAWGLYRNGWALATKDDGTLVFAMWPQREFAQLCAEFEWEGYEAQAFGLDELLDGLLPQLQQDGIVPGIFRTPGSKGTMPTPGLLRADLQDELKRQESMRRARAGDD
ncbi:DUF2750 domain-containing protein [uncultured Massilia sp.]|uniref:DUF2750 domain-containing protein n=1 Tax=uncultured Massilia sp. TaxID=169973 RepID=UPI0025EB7129|nr:DUF2750 domain-containing protein [uncultured Massilia sp.]